MPWLIKLLQRDRVARAVPLSRFSLGAFLWPVLKLLAIPVTFKYPPTLGLFAARSAKGRITRSFMTI